METSVITYVKILVYAHERVLGEGINRFQESQRQKCYMYVYTCVGGGGREGERKNPTGPSDKVHSCRLSFRPLILSQSSSPLATGA